MKERLRRLQTRFSALGQCPQCNDRGVPGIRLEYFGSGEHRAPEDPKGCARCGMVSQLTILRINTSPIGPVPLPGEPGAPYADE